MRERSDEDLMEAWAAGSMQAFEVLYARYRGPLYRYILRQVADDATANDLYQGSWEKIIKARKSYRPQAPFRAWMYRIAHNHVVDHFRRSRPESELEPERMESAEEGPDELLSRADRQQKLREALDSLPDKQRDAILLKLDAGLDLQTIADVTGVNRETAKSRLRYAVARLKHLMMETVP
jgi:RNA polymerase sigma-70 factor (ECF subfamily)